MALKNNTWKVNQWYDQAVAGNVDYNGTAAERTKLYVWGANTYGTLGLNAQGGWSEYLTAQSSPIQIPGDWSSLTFGPAYAHAINTDGELWAWGRNNNYGQLGVNNKTEYSSPVQVPGTTWSKVATTYDTSIATKTNGTLWAWGRNENGRLGQNSINDHKSSPVQIPGTTWSTNKNHLSASYGSFGAIKTNGTLWVWGDHGYGSLGQNQEYTKYSSPVQIPGTTWSQIEGGRNANFGIKTDGTLWSWGYNGPGHLGQNNRTKYSSPKQIPGTTWSMVSGGGNCVFAIKTDGTLWSWGSGSYGSLGQNTGSPSIKYSSPSQIGSDTTWSWVQAANANVYASKTDGTLWTWGDNQAGQNAQNDRGGYDGLWGPLLARSSPVQIPGTWTIDGIKISPIPARSGAAIKA
tara:strand:- start:44 stop:1258 length:1215 start_codon:yes stop_codon:yes gene_type:complete